MKKNRKKGFTLAELLVVVAIIAVLTAIAIPVFGAQLKKARLAADDANIRAAYAMVQAANITDEITFNDNKGTSYTWSMDKFSAGGYVYFAKDGTFHSGNPTEKTYQLQEGNHDDCQVPVVDKDGNTIHSGAVKGLYLKVTVGTDANNEPAFVLSASK